MNFKKIALIIGFILVIIGIAYLMYIFFFKPTPLPPPLVPPIEEVPPEGLPPVAERVPPEVIPPEEIVPEEIVPLEAVPPAIFPASEIARGGLTKTPAIIETETYGITLAPDGTNLQFYDELTGKFYGITPEGKTMLLTDKVFYDVEKITWSPNKNSSILEYPDGVNILYNFKTKKQVTLPKHWEEFNFSPDGNKIVLKSIDDIDPENNWLVVANPDGSGANAIEYMGDMADKFDVNWSPNRQVVAFARTGEPAGGERQEIYLVGQYDENFKSLTVNGRGFRSEWSPTGEKLLYSVYSSKSDYKPDLWVVDAIGDDIGKNKINIGIQTWADKCTFADANTVYCAVPEYLEEGSGWYPFMADDTFDTLYKINVRTGAKTILARPEEGYTIDEIIPSADGKYLYFTDKLTGYIHKIRLK